MRYSFTDSSSEHSSPRVFYPTVIDDANSFMYYLIRALIIAFAANNSGMSYGRVKKRRLSCWVGKTFGYHQSVKRELISVILLKMKHYTTSAMSEWTAYVYACVASQRLLRLTITVEICHYLALRFFVQQSLQNHSNPNATFCGFRCSKPKNPSYITFFHWLVNAFVTIDEWPWSHSEWQITNYYSMPTYKIPETSDEFKWLSLWNQQVTSE